jgi:hypothetical protein
MAAEFAVGYSAILKYIATVQMKENNCTERNFGDSNTDLMGNCLYTIIKTLQNILEQQNFRPIGL